MDVIRLDGTFLPTKVLGHSELRNILELCQPGIPWVLPDAPCLAVARSQGHCMWENGGRIQAARSMGKLYG